MATRLLSFFFFLLVAPSWCTYAALLLSVASDGSGNFTTIREAIEFAPSGSSSRTTIMLKAGIYYENLVVPRDKENLTLLGEGSSVTVITGNRSHAGGWSMHDTATVYVEAAGFAAHNLTFQNTAGPSGGQAVALHVEGDRSVFYRCVINGYQDTLYAHNGHQFYRDCVILGTVDFIFGDAAAVFQNCTIFPRGNHGGAITAHSRSDNVENTAFSFHRCSVTGLSDGGEGERHGSFYLGRPWKPYARVVFLRTYMDDVINKEGWVPWDGPGTEMPRTVYYWEFENTGPGADALGRLKVEGVRQIGEDEASRFTVGPLIAGDLWIPATGVPFNSQL